MQDAKGLIPRICEVCQGYIIMEYDINSRQYSISLGGSFQYQLVSKVVLEASL